MFGLVLVCLKVHECKLSSPVSYFFLVFLLLVMCRIGSTWDDFTDVTAMTVALTGSRITVEGTYIHIPPLNTTEQKHDSYIGCLTNYTVKNFRCLLDAGSALVGEGDTFRREVFMAARDNLTVMGGVRIDAPSIEGNR